LAQPINRLTAEIVSGYIHIRQGIVLNDLSSMEDGYKMLP